MPRHNWGVDHWPNLVELAGRARSEDEFLTEISAYCQRVARCEACDTFLVDGDTLVLKASTGHPEFNNRVRIGKRLGVIGRAFQSGKPVFIECDLEAQPEYAGRR